MVIHATQYFTSSVHSGQPMPRMSTDKIDLSLQWCVLQSKVQPRRAACMGRRYPGHQGALCCGRWGCQH